MASGVFNGVGRQLERVFAEKRILLKSDDTTRYFRFGPLQQAGAMAGLAAILAWSLVSAAVLLVGTVGAGGARDHALSERLAYEERITELAADRDARTAEAHRAHERFAAAMTQISAMQAELLESEERRHELNTGLGVVQATLRRTMNERDAARMQGEVLQARLDATSETSDAEGIRLAEAEGAVDVLAAALSRTAVERDALAGVAAESQTHVDDLILDAQLTAERNDRVFAQLEEAVSLSMEPLDKMFRAVGMEPQTLLDRVRGARTSDALGPIRMSTKSGPPDPEMIRANSILAQLAEMGAYREATELAPFAQPLGTSYRLTSGFGPRWGRRHEGIDFAAAHGTAIMATADGVVTFAGRQSGYGNIIKVKHAFGIETRFAHLSRIRVKVGQRVSRGDRIGDMGNTGRSTGTHLHYEVRVNGTAIDPMTYIKAARDVL